jgi:hypothetical protein
MGRFLVFSVSPVTQFPESELHPSPPYDPLHRNVGLILIFLLREHRHNIKGGLQEKSKLVQHACEEGRRVGWDEARNQSEHLPNSIQGRYWYTNKFGQK